MSIYNRDNINYSGMIANMLAAKQRGIESEKANTLAQGQIWSDLVNKLGGMAGRYVASRQVDEDEELLKKLEQERQQLIERQKLADAAAKSMAGYVSRDMPNYGNNDFYHRQLVNTDRNPYVTNELTGYYTPARTITNKYDDKRNITNAYALPGDSNATQSDYVNYLQAMNKLYGGF